MDCLSLENSEMEEISRKIFHSHLPTSIIDFVLKLRNQGKRFLTRKLHHRIQRFLFVPIHKVHGSLSALLSGLLQFSGQVEDVPE